MSDRLIANAENCALLAETAQKQCDRLRFKRMERAWRQLADNKEWLEGRVPPVWPVKQSDSVSRNIDIQQLSADELDILARAFESALEEATKTPVEDTEEIKAILMTGILDAAKQGMRDEAAMTAAALDALGLFKDTAMDAVMQTTPL
jgi:hypothetical protein